MALTSVASTNAFELISLDFLGLDIYKSKDGYNKEAWRSVSHHLAEAIMRVPGLPLLNWLKSQDYLLMADVIPTAEVDEDLTFKELDKASVTCSPLSSIVEALNNVSSSHV